MDMFETDFPDLVVRRRGGVVVTAAAFAEGIRRLEALEQGLA
jgi:hypothetical protein